MSEQFATPIERQALLFAAECGWGVTSHQVHHLIEVPAAEFELDDIVESVFGPSLGGDDYLPTGENIHELGEAFQRLESGYYLITRPARTDCDNLGFNEDKGDMGGIEPGESLTVVGPLNGHDAVLAWEDLTGRTISGGLS